MNKVYVMGVVASEPRLVNKDGNPDHLVFALRVSHRSKAGDKQEYYPINAWNEAAQWGAEQLHQGQRVLVDGYLTQQARLEGLQIQVTATRFYLLAELPQGRVKGQHGEAVDEPGETEVKTEGQDGSAPQLEPAVAAC